MIFVPVVNAGGFFAGTYRVPEDGENLNRCFPGAKGETYTWNMASALEAALYPQAGFLLDLHGGGIYETMEPLAFFPVDAGETVERISRQAGQTLSLTFLVQSFAKDGLYSWAAQQGIPGLLVERGGGGTWSRAEVDACKENILQLLDFLEIRPYGRRQGTPREVEDAHYETVQASGYWYPEKQPGDTFAQGELLGRVESGEGETLQAITAPFDGVVLFQTHILGVSQGCPFWPMEAAGGRGTFPPGNRRDAMIVNKNDRTQTPTRERDKLYSVFPGIWLAFQDVEDNSFSPWGKVPSGLLEITHCRKAGWNIRTVARPFF